MNLLYSSEFQPHNRVLGAVGLAFAVLLAALLAAAVLAASGDLDPTFHLDGKTTTDFSGTNDNASDAALQPDGRIILAGNTQIDGSQQFALARYNPDGALDPNFGSNGKTTTDFTLIGERVTGIAVQPDGKIVAAGFTSDYSSTGTTPRDIAIARYDAAGQLDATFGAGGKVVTDLGLQEYVSDVELQTGGKIVVAGWQCCAPNMALLLARYDTTGVLDSNFGVNGVVTTTLADYDEVSLNALAIQTDQKILVAGSGADSEDDDYKIVVLRYTADGVLDGTFGAAEPGLTVIDLPGANEDANDITLQPDGKLLVAGATGTDPDLDFALLRLDQSGVLDSTFGAGGILATDFGSDKDSVLSVRVQPDGKIVLGGSARIGSAYDFALARYTLSGALDTTFSSDGLLTTDFSLGDDYGRAVLLQPDGRIILAGYASESGSNNFALARYLTEYVYTCLYLPVARR